MYDLQRLLPVMTNDLIRFGRDEDGGYVINKRLADKTIQLLTFGINTDWSFEEGFYRYKGKRNLNIWAFDPSIDIGYFFKTAINLFRRTFNTFQFRNIPDAGHYLKLGVKFMSFFGKQDIKFFKKGIDNVRSSDFITFDDIFSKIGSNKIPDGIFVKMDIEGYEFKVCLDLLKYSEFINGFIIEFHDLDMKGHQFENLISMIFQKDFVVTHIHPNNAGGLIPGTQLPKLLEITFGKRSYFSMAELENPNVQHYPVSGVDCPCVKNLPELTLPFS